MGRGRRARVFAIGAVVGVIVGGVVTAQALNSTLVLNAGDTARVACNGPRLSIVNKAKTQIDLSCAPAPTTSATAVPPTSTTTVPPTSTTTTVAPTTTTTTTLPPPTNVTVDQVAKTFGTGVISATVPNTTSEVVVAFVALDDASVGQAATVSGGGLAWHLAGRTNAQRGDAEAWWAVTTGAPVTVTATPVQGGKNGQLTVMTYAGAVGAVGSASSAKAAPSVSLTPRATGSWVGAVGMDYDHAIARTLGAGQTIDNQNLDAASGDTYWVQHLNAPTTAGAAVTVDDTAPTTDRFNFQAVEVTATTPPPSTTLALDPSTPAIATVTNNVLSTTSPLFSPPASTVLYAAFSMDSSPGSGALVSSVSNTGTPLTWTQTNVENHSGGTTVGGFVQVFWAYNPTAQTDISVTGSFNVPTKNVTPPVGGFQVLVVDNADPDQATAASQAAWNVTAASAPTATLTTTAPNSLVFAVVDNWDSSVTPTIPSGQALTSIVLNPSDRDSYWLQSRTSLTASPSVVMMNVTAPSNIRWHEIAWEILAA